MEEKTEGIFIPENIVHNKNISMFGKVLYGVIASICERDGFCKKTNEHLAKLLGAQKCIVSRWIKKFSDKKLLKVAYRGKNNYIRFIFLPTTDKDIIKRTIQRYYSIVPTNNTIVPTCKNSKEYRASKHALNNTFLDDDSFDFNAEDMDKWLEDINVK